MADKRRVRIVSDGGPFSEVTDADTGELIRGVRTVSFEHRAGEAALARIEVIAEIDVAVEAEIQRLRLNTATGHYQPIADEDTQ